MAENTSRLPDELKDKSGAEVFRIVSHWPRDQWGPLMHPRVVSYAHKLRAESESRYNTTIAAKLKGWPKTHEFQSKVIAYKPPKAAPRYTILTLDHIFALSPPEFQVATFIPEESVTLIFGAPKVGKTFAVIDLACRIASPPPICHARQRVQWRSLPYAFRPRGHRRPRKGQ